MELGEQVIPELRRCGADRVAKSLAEGIAGAKLAKPKDNNLFEKLHTLQSR
jgi:hypothetical protein